MQSGRIEKWDNLKFLLIFFVVLGHFCNYHVDNSAFIKGLDYLIYLVHMPTFIFISGLFSKKNIDNKRFKNIFSYLFMFYIMKFIFFARSVIVFHDYSFQLLKEGGVPWFMFAIFAFHMITMALKRFHHRYVLFFSIILACCVGYDKSVSDFLILSRIIVFFPFFWAGYCLDIKKLTCVLNRFKVKMVSLCLLTGGIVVYVLADLERFYWTKALFTGRSPYSSLAKYNEYGFFLRMFYYIIVFIAVAVLISLVPNNIGKGIMARMGSRSLQIYTLHYIFIAVLYDVFHLQQFAAEKFAGYLGIYVIAVSLLVTLLCSCKFLEKPINFIMGRK